MASDRAMRTAAARSAGAFTSRMPLPPPPATALTSSGNPIRAASAAIAAVRRVHVERRRGARHDGHAGARRPHGARRSCCPCARWRPGVGPDERQPGIDTRLREVFVLGQEPVPGMDERRAGAARDVHHLVDAQVALRARARADVMRLVGEPHVQRGPVAVRVDGDRAEPSSRHARMTRTAISPRLAIRTFGAAHNGMLPCFLGGLLVALVVAAGERGDELRARRARLDDLVDEAARRPR